MSAVPSPNADAPRVGPAVSTSVRTEAVQRVVKVRRDYNEWVARETMEDYALRFTPHSFRKWSELRVANTAFGAASFLVLEAVGATLLVEYGFVNAFWAIIATGLIIFLAGLPISRYAARHGVDMDLLTRGAGFGYIGSTVTSLIYASFTFIFFALEAAVMAYALELAFDIPPAWGYLICALVVVPLVTHGVTIISRLQVWTQPLWILLLVVPYVFVFQKNPGVLKDLVGYAGSAGQGGHFNVAMFGAAMTVGIALITQMGEQVDYLRFMPALTKKNRVKWWAGVLIGGPGWVVPGVIKMLGGALLAFLAISHALPVDRAVDPNQMYLAAYEYVFPRTTWAIAATALLVVVSQLKINVTNAYAGSLAWSNFFARLTHSHPGRVVWVIFNTIIALMLMELNVFSALGRVLGLYSNIAISWMMAVVADLVINKPMGWSPKGIEFKRAHLYDINPVGVGAMGLASAVSIAAYLGWLGAMAQAFSALIALATAFVASPLIAWWTKGKYYLAREPVTPGQTTPVDPASPVHRVAPLGGRSVATGGLTSCTICERVYEPDDMAYCPAYLGHICSLCCSLDARCNDMCKPEASWSAQWQAAARKLLPSVMWGKLDTELGRYLLAMSAIVPMLGMLFYMIYQHELRQITDMPDGAREALAQGIALGFIKVYAALVVVTAIVTWWIVLTHKSRQVAQEESNRQTQALNEQARALRHEIESHQRTDEALQQAKRTADLANQAKSRYISSISHELRTPLNSIIGYAQLLDEDESVPAHRKQAVSVIRRGGDHLLSLIEGTLDIARIEGGKLTLDVKPMRFQECVQQIVRMFELQAAGKGLAFRHEVNGSIPDVVRTDEKRMRQVLINVLGNAVKFTSVGQVVFRLSYAREMAVFEIEDTGPGIGPHEIAQVFEPFARGSAVSSAAGGGTGLGLTISKMLTDLMGGEMTVHSQVATEADPTSGTLFRIRLFLPEVRAAVAERELPRVARIGYEGERRMVLVVDNEEVDRDLLVNVLAPLGFDVRRAASGHECLAMLSEIQPHAILMDLAMPGIDGWETIRRMRREGLSKAPVAIVSANAFDRGLDNDVGIVPGDFVLKPVRKSELLDWLGRALALQWLNAPLPSSPVVTAPVKPAEFVLPDERRIKALEDHIQLGYFRGIVRQLDEIAAESPQCAAFVAHMRDLARQFQLDAMSGVLRKARDARLAD
ncbi:ATP-binding protein [Piscinibacter terrae]|uniref:histidine kinase n=1 Tax=Piscinibacter terrae TaxID=2496871 RepID=A0A3N7JK69_9BURK|nr:ATP-binding protein [Albitalea terrae]RQP21719.1 response regulator [Albitalea terrae]